MTGSGDDTDEEQSSPAERQDPLEEVLGEETLSGPDTSDSAVPPIEQDTAEGQRQDTDEPDDPFVGPGEDRRTDSPDETRTDRQAPAETDESSRNDETATEGDTEQPDPSTVPKGSPREKLLTEDGVGGLYEPPEDSEQPEQTPTDRVTKKEPTENTTQTPIDRLTGRKPADDSTQHEQTATENTTQTPIDKLTGRKPADNSTQQEQTATENTTQTPTEQATSNSRTPDQTSHPETPSQTAGDQQSQGPLQDQQRTDPPPEVGSGGQPRPARETETASWQLFVKDIVTSVIAVALLGGYLFAISGIWPPMVAIESESMAPHMNVDDLVFLVDNDRFAPNEAQAGTGVVTAQTGTETGYSNYGGSGDVIVFAPDGNERTTPIIHRAMFWVEEGDNWCEQANPEYLGSLSPDNEECIAENAGFITKGDNNNRYDQAAAQADRPVKTEWVVGTAEARLPQLGWFRLQFQ